MAADWSKPSITDTYANFLKYLNAKLADSATMFTTGAPTNTVDQTVRWNATTARWEQYQAASTSWTALAANVAWGSVTLGADPVSNLQAATKQYVDALKTSVAAATALANTKMPITGGSFTNNITIDTSAINGSAIFQMNTLKNQNRLLGALTSGVQRWLFGANGGAENGSNSGSDFSIYAYSDTGAYLGMPLGFTRANLQGQFAVRPTFAGAIPWDSSNLPSPASATGGQTTNGDITLWQNQSAAGDVGRLHFTNATNGLNRYFRLNSTTAALELVNNTYSAVDFQFIDGGAFYTRGTVTSQADLRTYGNFQFLGAGAIYDYTSVQRVIMNVGDWAGMKGGGGGNNYQFLSLRNDGAIMGIINGAGDYYLGSSANWMSSLLAGKATANVFHHGATVANCGTGTSIGVTASGNTLQLTLATVNCNCNCQSNCSCFPAGSLVLMADGHEKPIEDVRIGELVAGPMGPVVVVALDRPTLGKRVLMQMGDDSLRWSDEHLLWARDRDDGREFWWGANLDRWAFEADTGHVGGVQDRSMLLSGPADYAHVDGFKSNAVQPVANQDPYTQLYLPVTDGSPIIVNGYMVGARVSDYNFDYDLIDWELDRHYIKGVIENASSTEQR